MGLETSTYIAGLTASWPVAADPKSQGDDHLRLLKGVLQATFPTASKPFYFPTTTVASANQTLLASDQAKIVMLSTAGGDLTVALPTLVAGDAGWSCEIVKTSTDANGIMVSPSSGTITSKAGATATIRVGVLAEPARFIWSGSAWFCSKPGVVGSTMNFDGPNLLAGYMILNGATFNATTYAELFAMLGTTTLRDKRGKVEAGVDGGVGWLTPTYFGVSPVLGAVSGSEYNVLTTTTMPSHNHGGVTGTMNSNAAHSHGVNSNGTIYASNSLVFNYLGGGGQGGPGVQITVDSTNTDHTHGIGSQGSDGAHANCQPTIITQKLIRAC